MKIDGRCHCGYLTYEADVDPADVTLCHCRDCQVLTGSAFSVVVPASVDSFKLTAGEPTYYVKIAESGNRRLQAFCPSCGTRLYSKPADSDAGYFGLRVGTIRQREALMPKEQIWRRSALAWVDHIGGIDPKSDTE
jgi:hypothetical protein